MNKMKTLLVMVLLLMAVPALAQDVTATVEATTPAVTSPNPEAVAVASVNLLFAFIGGLGVGGLSILAILMLLVNLILRSPVLLTAIEGLVFSRLDKEGVESLRGAGSLFSKAGELIDKVTDGKPNEVTAVAVQSSAG